MAKHFCHYLTLLGLPYYQWARKTHSVDALTALLAASSHIILLIRDDSIADFASTLGNSTRKTLIHFSGQLSSPMVYGAHPLMTFTENLYDEATYRSMPFVLEEGSPAFQDLLPGIPNNTYQIPAPLKAYYHMLCVISANFTCILWQKFFHDLQEKLHLPLEAGLPYLTQAFRNIAQNPQGAVTGPLVRKDEKTIQANLHALKNDAFYPIYLAFKGLYEHS